MKELIIVIALGTWGMAVGALWDIARHIQRIAVALEALKGG